MDRSLPPVLGAALIAACGMTQPAFAVTVGFVEDWPGTSVQGWNSFAEISNPGTGGTLGVGDGFLRVARTNPNNLGVKSNSADYIGDWLAAGASVRLALNDIETDQALSLHLAIGNGANMWQYNVGFAPPENAWGTFDVAFTDSTQFSHIVNGDGQGFAAAIQNADRLLIRHDLAPFDQPPDLLAGQFGIDHLQILGTGVGVELPLASGQAGRPVWLAPPFPNPSRGAVACAVEAGEGEAVRLSVVDARGRVVRTASLEAASAGRRTWMWDGRDDAGVRMAPGVYRVRAMGSAGGTSRSVVLVD